MKLNKVLLLAGVAAALTIAGNVSAQGQGGGRPDFTQMRQMRIEHSLEQLGITDESEKKAVEPLIGKVTDAQRDLFSGMGRGMFGGRGGRGRGGDNANRPGMPPNPAAEALQKAIDSKDAAAIKSKLEAYRSDVKAKQAALDKAQNDLKKVLTPQQEAVAVLHGLLK